MKWFAIIALAVSLLNTCSNLTVLEERVAKLEKAQVQKANPE